MATSNISNHFMTNTSLGTTSRRHKNNLWRNNEAYVTPWQHHAAPYHMLQYIIDAILQLDASSVMVQYFVTSLHYVCKIYFENFDILKKWEPTTNIAVTTSDCNDCMKKLLNSWLINLQLHVNVACSIVAHVHIDKVHYRCRLHNRPTHFPQSNPSISTTKGTLP